MTEPNPYTQAAERLADRLAEAEKEAKKSKAIPFGMEAVSADTEVKAFEAMNRTDKIRFMKQHSTKDDPAAVQYVLKMLRRGRQRA